MEFVRDNGGTFVEPGRIRRKSYTRGQMMVGGIDQEIHQRVKKRLENEFTIPVFNSLLLFSRYAVICRRQLGGNGVAFASYTCVNVT